MLDLILHLAETTPYDFRKTACPDDSLHALFDEWVPYYRMKWAIARALRPRRILEIGVRYGYSALAFLDACPAAEYTGLDLDIAQFGGEPGALEWAREKTSGYRATFLQCDSQKLRDLPGGRYDLIHVDGQQDGDGTVHDLEMALRAGEFILLDGYLWTRTNCLYASEFLLRYRDLIEYSICLNGYAGDLLIKPRPAAAGTMTGADSASIRDTYTRDYYTKDCGGFDSFKRTGGLVLEEERLRSLVSIAAASPRTTGRALDLGCGRGEASIALCREGFEVTAIDYSADAIAIAREAVDLAGLADRIALHCDDARSIPGEQLFDSAIAGDLIEHMNPEELEGLYSAVSKRLVPEGMFVIHTFPNRWYYEHEYKRRVQAAKSLGAYLPSESRSRYELLMHINEQNPRVLRRQLRRHFEYVCLWFAGGSDAGDNLRRRYSIAEMRRATDLYAVASHQPIHVERLRDALEMKPLAHGIEESLRYRIIECPEQVRAGQAFTFHVELEGSPVDLKSDHPCPVLLSYHWLDASAESTVAFEGLRTELHPKLRRNATCQYAVKCRAPEMTGMYTLRATMLQEAVRWFDGSAGIYDDCVVHVG